LLAFVTLLILAQRL